MQQTQSRVRPPKLITCPCRLCRECRVFRRCSELLPGCGCLGGCQSFPPRQQRTAHSNPLPFLSTSPHPTPRGPLWNPGRSGLQQLMQLPALARLPALLSPAPVLAPSTSKSSVPLPHQHLPLPQSTPLITLNGKDHKSFIKLYYGPN